MHQEENSCSQNSSNSVQESNYSEYQVEESREMLGRQNEAIKLKRDALLRFARYHFLLLGFIFAMAKIGSSSTIEIQQWEVFLASIPPLFGILLTTFAHRSLGSYNIGFDSDLFDDVWERSHTYVEALKRISEHYHQIADYNRTTLNKHDKYLAWNLSLLAAGFGLLLGSIMF